MITSYNAYAKLSVFTCEPEWQSLAKEIGGDRIRTFSATTAKQDPHHIEPRPSLIAKLRRADLLICSGAGLEEGWLPVLIRRSRNRAVQPGSPGYLMAADQVPLLEIPKRLDRSEGDIHAQGNPHLHLSPRNIYRLAEILSLRMARIDPENVDFYKANRNDFLHRWSTATSSWAKRASSLQGRSVVVHHQEWIYLLNWLGMRRIATLEPKPGIPPTAGHLAGLTGLLKTQPVLAIIRAPTNNPRPSKWLAGKTAIPTVMLPYTVGGTDTAVDLFALFEETVHRLVELIR